MRSRVFGVDIFELVCLLSGCRGCVWLVVLFGEEVVGVFVFLVWSMKCRFGIL